MTNFYMHSYDKPDVNLPPGQHIRIDVGAGCIEIVVVEGGIEVRGARGHPLVIEPVVANVVRVKIRSEP